MFPQACPDDAPEKPARPSDAAACSAGNSCGERLKELQDAGRAIVEAWDFDEVGQIDGELIENMRRLIDPQNMERDKFKCVCCRGADKTLNVHHSHYRKGADPWDYDDKDLMTVCEDCHGLLEVRREMILKATANPRIQIAILHFASVMNFNFGPYSTTWEVVLTDLHTLLEFDDDIKAAIAEKRLEDAELAIQDFERTAFGVMGWIHRIHQNLQTSLSSAQHADYEAYQAANPTEGTSPA